LSPTRKDTSRELKHDIVTLAGGENNNVLHLKENNIAAVKDEDLQMNNFCRNVQVQAAAMTMTMTMAIEPISKTKIITYEDYKLLKFDELDFDRRTFSQFFKDFLIRRHSLISLIFKKSLFEPCFLKLFKLLFELNLQFAFCAILFSDSYIDKRLTYNITVKIYLHSLISIIRFTMNSVRQYYP
jgi:hypothetical protein